MVIYDMPGGDGREVLGAIIIALFFILLVFAFVEVCMASYAFFTADSVTCDLFSCVAKKTTVEQHAVVSSIVVSEEHCFVNGVESDLNLCGR